MKAAKYVLCVIISYSNRSIASQVILDPKTSRRIFELARVQQEELQSSEEEADEDYENKDAFTLPRTQVVGEERERFSSRSETGKERVII